MPSPLSASVSFSVEWAGHPEGSGAGWGAGAVKGWPQPLVLKTVPGHSQVRGQGVWRPGQ